jgi:hypothetical protein
MASWGSTRAAALWVVSQRVPGASRSFFARLGTSPATSVVNASPRASTAASASRSARESHAPGLVEIPLCRMKPSSLRRSRSATVFVAAACTAATSSRGTTQRVRRIASIRTSVRSS